MAIDAALGRLGNKSGVCTSSTRPTNPFEGQLIYETDTNRTLVYDNSAWLVVADNQVLSIDSANGRVGVGTTAPTVALQVDSGSTDQYAAPQIYIAPSGHASSDRAAIQLDDIQLLTDIFGNGAEDFSIYSNNAATHRFSIDGSGNVGIGTTSPVLPIDFNAPGTSGARMRFEDGTSETSGIQFTANGSAVNYSTQPFIGKTNPGDSDDIGIWHSGAWRLRVNSDGQITTPSQPAFKAHASITNHPNGGILTYANVSYNIGNHLNAGTGVFTAPVSGVYLFYGQLRADVNTYYVHSNIYINGANSRQYDELPGLTGSYSNSNNGFTAGTFVYSRYINANDGISFNMNVPSGSFNVHSQTFIAGHLIG